MVPFATAYDQEEGQLSLDDTVADHLPPFGYVGGSIGSTTYMVYLPEQKVSVVAMVNAFPTSSIDDFTRGLMREVLRDMGELGWLPYIPPVQRWLFAAIAIGLAFILYRWRRKSQRRSD